MAYVELPTVFVVVKPYQAAIARRLTRYGRLDADELLKPLWSACGPIVWRCWVRTIRCRWRSGWASGGC